MELDKPVLTDPKEFPTEQVIFSRIGKKKTLWIDFFDVLGERHSDLAQQWRYYEDGKNWLMKVTRKSKTIFWLSVWDNAFKITFYFSDKAEPLIEESGISESLKKSFKEGKRYGKVRGLTIDFSQTRDIENAESLIAIRRKV